MQVSFEGSPGVFGRTFFPRQPRIGYMFFISKAVFQFGLNVILIDCRVRFGGVHRIGK